MGVTIELAHGVIEITRMADYLLVVERGRITSAEDIALYEAGVREQLEAHSLERAIIDARIPGKDFSAEARIAHWAWLATKPFERLAVVADTEMQATELNMEGVSRGIPMRAFVSIGDARQWLRRPQTGRGSVLPPIPAE
jgi:hypothetical protein